MTPRIGIWPAIPGLLVLGLSGCSIDPSYFAPTAAQVVLLDVPMGILGELEEDISEAGTSISVTLVRVGQSGSAYTDEDLLTGASVTLHFVTNPTEAAATSGDERVQAGEVNLTIPENPDYPGVYFLNSSMDDRLVYNPGVNYMVKVDHGGESYEICMVSAPRTTLESPLWAEYVEPGTDVPVTYGPEAALPFLGVFDTQGQVAYTNFPTDPTNLYRWISSSSGSSARIPGSALNKEDIFGVAIAGMRVADWDSSGATPEGSADYISSNLNPLGSVFISGSSAVTSITTLPLDFVSGAMIGGGESGEPVHLQVDAWSIDPLDLISGEAMDVKAGGNQEVWLVTPAGQRVDLHSVQGSFGSYVVDPDSRLSYDPEAVYTVHLLDRYDNERLFAFSPEPKVRLDLPEGDGRMVITEGEGLELTWAPLTDGADIRVYSQDGDLVYSTAFGMDPADAAPMGAAKEQAASVWLPASAFSAGPGAYQVGVVGMTRSVAQEGTYALNRDYSGLLTGETTFGVVMVEPDPEAPVE